MPANAGRWSPPPTRAASCSTAPCSIPPAGAARPADPGTLRLADGRPIAIVDTVKGDTPDSVWHVPVADSVLPPIGAEVIARIDWDRRYRLMRMHTCLPLLSPV